MISAPCSPPLAKEGEQLFSEPTAWILHVDGAASGRENMSRDAELLSAQDGAKALPELRIYRWAEPTVSHGRLMTGETARRWAEARGGAASGAAVVARPTGGGLVFHHTELSFALAWRRGHRAFPVCLRNIYRSIHATAAEALSALGLRPHLFDGTSAAPGGACFDGPVKDDVMVGDRKAVGGALRVTSTGRLYQGDVRNEEFGLSGEAVLRALAEAFAVRFFRNHPMSEFSISQR